MDRPPIRRSVRFLALAVAIVLGLGAILVWRTERRPVEPPPRDASPRLALRAPADGAEVSSADSVSWFPVTGATIYAVEVASDGGVLLGSLRTTETSVKLPITSPVAAARWWVSARLSDGSVLRSEVRRLRLRGSPLPP